MIIRLLTFDNQSRHDATIGTHELADGCKFSNVFLCSLKLH